MGKQYYFNIKFLMGIILFATVIAVAQTAPAVMIKDDQSGRSLPLGLHELDINVQIVGNIATTTMTMTFHNELDRVLEGQLYFPLGAGQTVSRFAMDINGKLREGVVIEKNRGRQIFESIVRQAIDPGLLEYASGNTFKSRIYPIPARGYKKILVAYEQELSSNAVGFIYQLPLRFREKVERFYLKVEVLKQPLQPQWDQIHEMANLKFNRWRQSFLAEAEQWYYLPDKTVSFTIPKIKDQPRYFKEIHQGEKWFYLTVTPPAVSLPEKEIPEKICLLWDVSGSAAGRDTTRELALLDRYFQEIGSAEITLVTFSNEVHTTEKYQLRKGKWFALRQRLLSVNYDGATQFGSLNLKNYRCDEYILCSDGISNFGDDRFIPGNAPVQIINSQVSAEHGYLKNIANQTGGHYLNLENLTLDQALRQLQYHSLTFLGAEYDKDEISDVYPARPEAVNGEFSMAGKLHDERPGITLKFGVGKTVYHRVYLAPDFYGDYATNGIIQRIWAQKQIADLNIRPTENREQITDTALKYGIVTPYTSLIVLDRLEDYITHRIVPPAEMREAYYAAIESAAEIEKTTREEHLTNVLTRFQERQRWWEKDFRPFFEKPAILPADTSEGMIERFSRMLYDVSPTISSDDAAGEEMTSSSGRLGSAGYPVNSAGSASDEVKSISKDTAPAGSIELARWQPNTPYLKKLFQADSSQWLTVYFTEKANYSNSSAFFLDMADFFSERQRHNISLRILSNLAEMELENHQLLRILGHRLSQSGHLKLAAKVFEDVLSIREEEPQSYRDLALVLSRIGEHQRAVNLLYEIVERSWDDRFPEIEQIALDEMNAIVALQKESLDLSGIDARFLVNLPLDIRVVLNWDADNCDMDLWVTDPDGEKCYYDNAQTRIGGQISRDFTGGYGPETFSARNAKPGKYSVQINYYGNSQQILAGETTVQVQFFIGWGTEFVRRQETTLRLANVEAVIDAGSFYFVPGYGPDIGQHFETDREMEEYFARVRFANYRPDFRKLAGPWLLALLAVLILLVPAWGRKK